MPNDISNLISTLLKQSSSLDQNKTITKLVSTVKKDQIPRDHVLKSLEKLKGESSVQKMHHAQLLYYACLLRLKYLEEVKEIFRNKDADQFSLEYVCKNLCKFVSDGALVEREIARVYDGDEWSQLRRPHYRRLLVKRVRKEFPSVTPALFEKALRFDKSGKEALLYLLYLPDQTADALLDTLIHMYHLNVDHLEIFSEFFPTLFSGVIRLRPMLIIRLTEKILEQVMASTVDSSTHDRNEKLKRAFNNNLIRQLVNGFRLPHQIVNAYIDLIEQYKIYVDGERAFPGLCVSMIECSLSNPELRQRLVTLVSENVNKSGLLTATHLYVDRWLDVNIPLSNSLAIGDVIRLASASFKRDPYNTRTWSQYLRFIHQNTNSVEKQRFYDAIEEATKDVREESFVSFLEKRVPINDLSILEALPPKPRQELAVKLYDTFKETRKVVEVWEELNFVVFMEPSWDLHKRMKKLIRSCREKDMRPTMHQALISHHVMHQFTLPYTKDCLEFIVESIQNEPNENQIQVLDLYRFLCNKHVKYHTMGDFLVEAESIAFYKALCETIINAKDRTTANLTAAFYSIFSLYCPLFCSMSSQAIDKHQDVLSSFFEIVAMFLEKRVALPTCLRNEGTSRKKFLNLFNKVISPHVEKYIADLKVKEIVNYVKILEQFEDDIHSNIRLHFIKSLFKEPVYTELLSAGLKFGDFVHDIVKEDKAMVEKILSLDPSFIFVKDIQEYLIRERQDLLKTFLFDHPLSVSDFKAIKSRASYSMIKRGEKFCFRPEVLAMVSRRQLCRQSVDKITQMLITFIEDPDNAQYMHRQKSYLRTLLTLHSDHKSSAFDAFIQRITEQGDTALMNQFLLEDLLQNHPETAFSKLVSVLNKQNVSIVSTQLLKAQKYLQDNSWIDVVVKRIEDGLDGVSTTKALVGLLLLPKDEQILKEVIFYNVWNDKKVHKDVRCVIVKRLAPFLHSEDSVAWKILDESSRDKEIDVVTELFSIKVSDEKQKKRLSHIQIQVLTHPDERIVVKGWVLFDIGNLHSSLVHDHLIKSMFDFSVKSHALFSTILRRSFSFREEFADKVSHNNFRKRVLESVRKELVENKEKYIQIEEQYSFGTKWDLPVRHRMKQLIQNLPNEDGLLVQNLWDPILGIDHTLKECLLKEFLKGVANAPKDKAIETIVKAKKLVDDSVSDPFSLYSFHLLIALNVDSVLRYSRAKDLSVELMKNEKDDFLTYVGVKSLRSQCYGVVPIEYSELVKKLRSHKSPLIAAEAREFSWSVNEQ